MGTKEELVGCGGRGDKAVIDSSGASYMENPGSKGARSPGGPLVERLLSFFLQ